MAGYKRKTRDEYQLLVNYGQGWEHEISEDTRREIVARAREYRENCPQYPVKWRVRRVPIEAPAATAINNHNIATEMAVA